LKVSAIFLPNQSLNRERRKEKYKGTLWGLEDLTISCQGYSETGSARDARPLLSHRSRIFFFSGTATLAESDPKFDSLNGHILKQLYGLHALFKPALFS